MSGRRRLGEDRLPILWLLIGYRSVFEIDDGLEVDEINLAIIERTRVYFDDVLGITFHQVVGMGFLIFAGICSLFFGVASVSAFSDGNAVAGTVLLIVALSFGAIFLLRAVLKVSVITVYGKRTMACVKFPMRTAHARRVYEDLARKIGTCQDRAAAEAPPPPVPPAPDLPLPPAPPAI
jgi:uncharacterized membrane protein